MFVYISALNWVQFGLAEGAISWMGSPPNQQIQPLKLLLS